MLKDKKIAVYITGGIAAYKIPDFVRQLIKAGAQVRVAMTPAAKQFVNPFTFEVLTKYSVLVEGEKYADPIGHIALADWTDLALVVPATANTIAKLANGIGDNEATAALLATDQPTMIVPAMNSKMWQHPAVQRNVATLGGWGYKIIDPAVGFLAEGYEGKGRMPETSEILTAVKAFAAWEAVAAEQGPAIDLSGQRVVVSAGGTEEAIDPVRFISNRSSGKMGLALAHVAALAGADVTLVRTASAANLPVLPAIKVVPVHSAQDLYEQMHAQAHDADIIIMAAAVSDYRVAQVAEHKLKKQNAKGSETTLKLVENPDILASLPKDRAFVVGFAAETENIEVYAQAKLAKKGAHMIVANNVRQQEIGFASDDNAVTIVTSAGMQVIPRQSKFMVAAHIIQQIMITMNNR